MFSHPLRLLSLPGKVSISMIPFLLITDLDNTLVGDDIALVELNRRLEIHRKEYGSQLVYSTGRSVTLYRQLTTEKSLLEPDALILSVGTEVYLHGSETPQAEWSDLLAQNWDRELVVATAAHFADLSPQSNSEQRPFKVSFFLPRAVAEDLIPQLERSLTDQGLDVQLIYSGGLDLDILPRQANKGKAMAFLRETLGISPTQTVACGDSGNDLAMFADRPERGIIVGNAMPELLSWHHANPNGDRYLAKAHCAGGILEGLQHFGFLEA
jgi:sucrose-6F-phosphate phosphohydrolase